LKQSVDLKERVTRCLLKSRRKAAKDDVNWIEDRRAFLAHAAATGDALSPNVEHQVAATVSFPVTAE